ncbi:RidA family protein [Aquimarina algicola]|uniref:RidA family protein n=1 Tax=Aquimarina algicola TaxID=2589995 RepID=A0A504J7G9_9FLAO|nr:RidA family protein [Aquimarina algicola]TPN86767.1 RidA family protein [Aquimarina algicola]
MSKTSINPKELYDGSIFGMSQSVIETDSKLVFISGQVDWNHQLETTSQTVEEQFKNALKNLSIVLKASKSSIENLLQLRIYIKGELNDHLNAIGPLLTDYLGTSKPAITGVGVTSLASPSTLVEIEAIASSK